MTVTVTTQYSDQDVQQLAEFLVQYQLEADGSIKALPTAIIEAKERLQYDDFKVRAENSVDGKEHIFTFTSRDSQ